MTSTYFPLSSTSSLSPNTWIPPPLSFSSSSSCMITTTTTSNKVEQALIFSTSPSPSPSPKPSSSSSATQTQTRRRRTTLSPKLTGGSSNSTRHRHINKHLKPSSEFNEGAPHLGLLFSVGKDGKKKEKEKEREILRLEGVNDIFGGMNYSFTSTSNSATIIEKEKGKGIEPIQSKSSSKLAGEEVKGDIIMNGLIEDLDSLVVVEDEKVRIGRKDRKRIVRVAHPSSSSVGNVSRRGLREGRSVKSCSVSIKDLPEELMIKIFNYLPDRYGFKPISLSNKIGGGSEWYTPPLAFGLVCKYFLNIARQVFYRTITLNNTKRIQRLHKVLQDPILGSFVQRIKIQLPLTTSESLDIPIEILSTPSSRLNDSYQPPEKRDKGLIFKPRWTFLTSSILPVSEEKEGIKVEYITPREMLRNLLRACPNLLSLEVSGIDLSTLLSPPLSSTILSTPNLYVANPLSYASVLSRKVSTASTPLISPVMNVPNQKLLQLRLDSITILTLSSTINGINLTSKELSSSIQMLSNLTNLKIVGYQSSISSPLIFTSSNLNTVGNQTKSLPNRARKISLKKLKILDSNFNELDMINLFSIIQLGTLRILIIEQIYQPKLEIERNLGNRHHGRIVENLNSPTLCTLPSIQHLLGSLTILHLSLYNYSPPSPGSIEYQENLNTINSIDKLLPHLTSLEELNIGGNIATSNFLNFLPSTVRNLRLLNCTTINPFNLKSFLKNISICRSTLCSSSSSTFTSSNSSSTTLAVLGSHAIEIKKPSQLKNVVILGNFSNDWRNTGDKKGKISNWDLQRACWDAGITWRDW